MNKPKPLFSPVTQLISRNDTFENRYSIRNQFLRARQIGRRKMPTSCYKVAETGVLTDVRVMRFRSVGAARPTGRVEPLPVLARAFWGALLRDGTRAPGVGSPLVPAFRLPLGLGRLRYQDREVPARDLVRAIALRQVQDDAAAANWRVLIGHSATIRFRKLGVVILL